MSTLAYYQVVVPSFSRRVLQLSDASLPIHGSIATVGLQPFRKWNGHGYYPELRRNPSSSSKVTDQPPGCPCPASNFWIFRQIDLAPCATLTPLASLAPLATGRAVARAPALIASQVRHSGHAHTMQDRRHRAGGTFLGWPIDDLGWPIDDLYHSYFRGEWLHLCFTQLSLVEPLTSAAQGPRTGSPLTHRFLGYGYLNRQLHVIVY